MTYNEAVLALIGEANNEYVEIAFEFMNKTKKAKEKPSARKYLRYAAVCIGVLLVIAVSVVLINKTKENDKTIPPDKFIIENGVLVKYNGSEETVEIPDGVTRIASTAFEDNEAAGGIKILYLGKNVKNIDDSALQPLEALEEIKVVPDNQYYEVNSDILMKKNGTLAFASIGNNSYMANKNEDSLFLDTLKLMEKSNEQFRNNPKIMIGKTTLNIRREVTDYGVRYYISSVEAFGKTFDETDIGKIKLVGNGKFQAFEADGCFVIAFIENGAENGKTCIITKNSVIKVDQYLNDSEYDYNKSQISFYGGTELLLYNRIPTKFKTCTQIYGGVFEKCVSKEELYYEMGKVIINGNEIELIPMVTIPVRAGFDLNEEYLKWCDTAKIDPNTVSMDEYLEENSKKYERAK